MGVHCFLDFFFFFKGKNFNILRILGFPRGSAGKESPRNVGDLGSIPGLGSISRLSPGERTGYPLQCSGQENSMDCIVHGVARSRTRLRDCHFQHLCREERWEIVFSEGWNTHKRSGCDKHKGVSCV